ncbi:MAG: hypothetical protein SNH73_08385 [Rikenellaceae bacterium]
MQQKLSDWERLESVIEWANMTTNYFARYIGLSRGENLYQIKRGNNAISRNLATMIVAKFPQVNLLWLLTGDGQMLCGEEHSGGSIPFYNVDVEQHVNTLDTLEPYSPLVLPPNIDCDFGMLYLGRAMGDVTPPNSVLLLKKILPEMIIPGNECVIVTKKIVLLRIVKLEAVDGSYSRLRLIATNDQLYGDIVVDLSEVESAYAVRGKIIIS